MNPERWEQVKEVLHQALERAPGGRVWLSDSRRLLFQDKIFLLDSQSKKVHEVLSVTPHNIAYAVTLSRDDRQIYFSLVTTEQTSG
jgi:hypothetical protein